MKLSDCIIKHIADLGVRCVFLVPGGGAMHLNESLARCSSMKFIANLHEQASALAAEAYGRTAGPFGCAMVTTGPGGSNAVTGVLAAWQDSTPCLFLSGQVKRADLMTPGMRQMGVQEVDIVSIVKSITKYAVTITDPATTRYHLTKAIYLATSGRPGPVWVDIPLDIQAMQIEWETQSEFKPTEGTAAASQLRESCREVLHALAASERPVFLAGNGIRVSGALEVFHQVAAKLNIPVMTTVQGIDLFDNEHELFAGRPGGIAPRGPNFAIQNSDLVLAVGARLDLVTIGYSMEKFARAAKKIVVDIDKTELAKFGNQLSLPICADAKEFLTVLLEESRAVSLVRRQQWIDRCAEWLRRYPIVLPEHRARKDRISTVVFSETLANSLSGGELIVTTSAGAAIELFYLAFKAKRNQRIFHNRGTGGMGFALPASIGACMAVEGMQVICVDADGGIQCNIHELATIFCHQLPIKIFVLNNSGYASIRASQKRYFGNLMSADKNSGLFLPDIENVGRAYNISTYTVSSEEELKPAIQSALASKGPVIYNILLPEDEVRAPCLSSRQKEDGSIVSTPLEDLWPFLDRKEFLENMIIPPLPESLG